MERVKEEPRCVDHIDAGYLRHMFAVFFNTVEHYVAAQVERIADTNATNSDISEGRDEAVNASVTAYIGSDNQPLFAVTLLAACQGLKAHQNDGTVRYIYVR